MRLATALLGVMIVSAAAATGQELPAEPNPARFGVGYDPVAYPQSTPAEAVQSASKASERLAGEYLLAHLVNPATVNQRVAARGLLIRLPVEKQLRAQRDSERGQRDVVNRLPFDPAAFDAVVAARTGQFAFRALAENAQSLLAARPNTGRELRRFVREGTLTEAGPSATYTLRGDSRVVNLVKIGERWFIDDAQTPVTPPVPAAKE